MSSAFKCCLVVLVSFLSITQLSAQQDKQAKKQEKESKIARLVKSKNYVFVAQSMLPLAGRNIQLTSRYDLLVAGDTVRSELPYYGRAYVAPISPYDAGIRFKATDVKYTLTTKKEAFGKC